MIALFQETEQSLDRCAVRVEWSFPHRDMVLFFQRLVMLYINYIQIFWQLEEASDQVVHPQKGWFIHKILDGVTGRVLELYNVNLVFLKPFDLDDVTLTYSCLIMHFITDITEANSLKCFL